MIKFTSNGDFNFGVESVSLITDSKQLVKRASTKELLKYEKTAGQEDLHIIALGSYEGVGFNRNGDCFLESDCKKNNQSFVKAARAVHRHHKNKKQDPKYGNIKAAAYNEPMKRIELIVGLDKDKCADILDEQEKKGYTNWSMASRQKNDECSWCGHKATTDEDRCEHIPSQIGELNKQGQMCGMINPDPNWFEISYVSRPADRIGMSLRKLANDSSISPMLPSDFLKVYSGFQPPVEEFLISKKANDKRSLLHKLAEMEKHIEAISNSAPKTSKDLYLKTQASKLNKSDDLSDTTIDELRKFDPSRLLKVLADHGIIFSPTEFVKYLFGNRVSDKSITGMKSHLPKAFSKIDEDDGETGEAVNNEKFEPSMSDVIPKEIKDMISGLMDNKSMFAGPAKNRVMRITIIKGNMGELKPHAKEQTKEAFDKELAKSYCMYKLSALNYIDSQDKLDEDLLWNAVIQNRK